jgi:drug/metabolite transporter (DMT)-like permease
MSVVAPLTAVLSAAVPVAVGMLRGERPGTIALAGLVIAAPAMVLIGREPRRPGGREGVGGDATRLSRGALASALSAGVSFGGFYVLMAQTGSDGGAWPLVAQRAASVVILLALGAAALMRGRPAALPRGRILGLTVVAGLNDFAANLAYLLATHRGLLALVAVISSLYPASTLLLARGLLKERLARQQGAGLLLAAAAVALIALR